MIHPPLRAATLGASDPYAAHYARARWERSRAVRAAFAALARALARVLPSPARRPIPGPRNA